jgi:hypothetical protein
VKSAHQGVRRVARAVHPAGEPGRRGEPLGAAFCRETHGRGPETPGITRHEGCRVTLLGEGPLGPPPTYALPALQPTWTEDHPLSRLAAETRARQSAQGFDPLAVLARDADRFQPGPGPVWGLAPERLPEALVIGHIRDSGGRYPLDRFVAIPDYPRMAPCAVDLLLKSCCSLVDQPVVTCFGEQASADLHGVIFTRYLDGTPAGHVDGDGSSDLALLRLHLHPRRAVARVQPELFSWSSAFASALEPWPGVAGMAQLRELTGDQQVSIASACGRYGLQALAAESESTHVRQAANRLLQMGERGLVALLVTDEPCAVQRELAGHERSLIAQVLPAPHGLAYLLAAGGARSGALGTLVVPLQWVAVAMRQPIVALVHLVRVASLARDGYFDKLAGTSVVCSRQLRAVAEVSQFDLAVARADGLAAAFLDEALRYDNRVYGIQVDRDEYCRAIEGKAGRFGLYDDPPEPHFGGDDGGPGGGPGGDSTDLPRQPPQPRQAPAA